MLRTFRLGSPLINNSLKPVGLIFSRGMKLEPDELKIDGIKKLLIPNERFIMNKFTSFARALQNDIDLEKTLDAVEESAGSKEHARLTELLSRRVYALDNWLTPWWIDDYLANRSPLPLNSNPALLFPKFNYSDLDGQVETAARIIQGASKYYLTIIRHELKEEKLGKYPLCMNQYKKIFGTTRVPAHGKDILLIGNQVEPKPNHIIVLRNGHIFRLSVFDSEGDMLSINQLKHEIMQNIIPKSENVNPHPVCVVSSDERGIWADLYTKLKETSGDQLKVIEDSLFAVCLDQKMSHINGSNDMDKLAHQCLHGGGCHNNSANRWYDKTIQFIIGTDGYCGTNMEHTPAEATPIANLMDDICDSFDDDSFMTKDSCGNVEPTTEIKLPVSDEWREVVDNSKTRINKVAADSDIKVYSFDHFGKQFIKNASLSTDAMMQLALHIAYYRMYRHHAIGYETASLRLFYDGRTENIRTPCNDFVYFVTDLLNDERPDSFMAQTLIFSLSRHRILTMEAMEGQGFDRYLYGLKKIAIEHGQPLPKIFELDVYKQMMSFNLSTSQVPTRHFIPVTFGPMTPDGYGICYNPYGHNVNFNICTMHNCIETSTARFVEELETSLLSLHELVNKFRERVE